jgi:hypothetical protein
MTTTAFSTIERLRMNTERNMKMRRSLSTAVLRFVGGAIGGLLLTATAAHAQATASSTYTVAVSGTLGTPSKTGSAASPGTTATAPEAVSCTGPLKISAVTVRDAIMPPSVVFSFDSRSLSCVGQTSKIAYVNSGQANLTRPLVASDVVETTFAFYQNVAGGYLKARTAVATLNVSYDMTTGAITAASGTIKAF